MFEVEFEVFLDGYMWVECEVLEYYCYVVVLGFDVVDDDVVEVNFIGGWCF